MITTNMYLRNAGKTTYTKIYQDTAASTRRTLDYSLNNGKLVLSKQKSKVPYNRFDGLEIEYSDGTITKTEWYRIIADNVEIEAKGEDKLWTHTISLIEPKKLHERILIGSKIFSRNKDGTAIYNLYQVITILIKLGIKKSLRTTNSELPLVNISEDIKTLLERIEAPRLGFDNPTLKEALEGALSVIDATYEIDLDNNLILIFFNKKTGEVAEISTFDDEERSVEGDYYETEMDVIVNNSVDDAPSLPPGSPDYVSRHTINQNATRQSSQNIEGTSHTVGVTASVGQYLRSEDVVIGDSNQILKLQENLRVYEIEDVFIGIKHPDETTMRSARCTEYFVTEAEYAKLKNAPGLAGSSGLRLPAEPCRQNTMKYSIGGNTVTGFGTSWGVFGLQRSLNNMVKSIFERDTDNFGGKSAENPYYIEYFGVPDDLTDKVLFTFVYRPIVPKMRITAARTITDKVNIKSSLRQNQSESFVSIQHYGDNLIGKANRMGNEVWTATQTLFSLTELYDRGFTTSDGYIVTEVEKIFWPEFLKVKYTLTKDFNKISQYIGIAGRRRQYELLTNTTTDRLMNFTEYLQVIPGNHTFKNKTTYSDEALEAIIDSLLFAEAYDTIRGVIVESPEFDIDPRDLNNYDEIDSLAWYDSTEDYFNDQDEEDRDTIFIGSTYINVGIFPDGGSFDYNSENITGTYERIDNDIVNSGSIVTIDAENSFYTEDDYEVFFKEWQKDGEFYSDSKNISFTADENSYFEAIYQQQLIDDIVIEQNYNHNMDDEILYKDLLTDDIIINQPYNHNIEDEILYKDLLTNDIVINQPYVHNMEDEITKFDYLGEIINIEQNYNHIIEDEIVKGIQLDEDIIINQPYTHNMEEEVLVFKRLTENAVIEHNYTHNMEDEIFNNIAENIIINQPYIHNMEDEIEKVEYYFSSLGTQSRPYDRSFGYYVGGEDESTSCPSIQATQQYFTSNADPNDYNLGDIIRVNTYRWDYDETFGGSWVFCNDIYYEVKEV